MILPGRSLISRKIVSGVASTPLQAQPCGVDLTLKRVLTWTSAGTVDFDNRLRQPASAEALPTPADTKAGIHLPHGSYLVEFNETVAVPLDAMGQIFVRSSLFRSGALLSAGVMDSGYKGAVGALLQVVNPFGLRLHDNARLAQLVFHQMSEPVEGYSGVYQGSKVVGAN
ncbi:hypothetical protein SLS56_009179 [Neofusicoccum ribis]|uniref:Deoxyuridine 5'-triphosphate nucleotidohydrolase n=1 Tax=Neofusicoccum ribis TaxID=45134 RepID=A0ABR3SI06_9PEZI